MFWYHHQTDPWGRCTAPVRTRIKQKQAFEGSCWTFWTVHSPQKTTNYKNKKDLWLDLFQVGCRRYLTPTESEKYCQHCHGWLVMLKQGAWLKTLNPEPVLWFCTVHFVQSIQYDLLLSGSSVPESNQAKKQAKKKREKKGNEMWYQNQCSPSQRPGSHQTVLPYEPGPGWQQRWVHSRTF